MSEIIIDEWSLKRHLSYLSDLKWNECYLVFGCVKERFAERLMNLNLKDVVLLREVVTLSTDWRERLEMKIWRIASQLERADRCFKVKGKFIIPEVTCVMMLMNPRDSLKANLEFGLRREKLIYDMLLNLSDSSLSRIPRLDLEWYRSLHKKKSRCEWIIIDIDENWESLLQKVLDLVSPFNVKYVINTFRGYHIALHLPREEERSEFFKSSEREELIDLNVEILTDSLEPLAGTRYGDKVIEFKEV